MLDAQDPRRQEAVMAVTEVVPGLIRIPLAFVNAYALVGTDGVTLIDTGMPGRHERVLDALAQLGHGPEDVASIVITHLHADHTGGLRALRERTGARVYAHPVDARAIREGVSTRRVGPEGTWLGRVAGFVSRVAPVFTADAAEVDVEVEDGATIDGAVSLEVVHAPGHSAGQIALLWREHGGVLIAGDAATHRSKLGRPPFYENTEEGEATLRRLAAMEFEVAVFGHGGPIRSGAAQAFRDRFGSARWD